MSAERKRRDRSVTRMVAWLLLVTLAGCSPQTRELPEATVPPIEHPEPQPVSFPLNGSTEPATFIRFSHLGPDQGLSQSTINCLLQDRQGFIWIGTQDGLNRYDGYSFQVFRPDPNDATSLSDRWINSLLEDSQGFLWIGTRLGGLNRYDPRSGEFTRFLHDPDDPSSLISDQIQAIVEDQYGQIWVGTVDGLDRYSPARGGFEHYTLGVPVPLEHASDNITTLFEDSSGTLWVGTAYAGLSRFDETAGRFITYSSSPGNPHTLSSNSIRAIQEDPTGALWVATDRGLNLFQGNSGITSRYQHASGSPGSLAGDVIRSLYVDQAGNVWVGTNQGLDRFDRFTRQFIHYQHDPTQASSLSNDLVTTIFESSDSVLWVGTYGGGLNRYFRGQDRFSFYSRQAQAGSSLSGNVVTKLQISPQGLVWIGLLDGGVNSLEVKSGRIEQLVNDPSNPESLMSDEVWSVYTDTQGTLWVGSALGLDRREAGTSAFRHYQHAPGDTASLIGAPVYDLLEDPSGGLWIATEFGLDYWDRDTDIFVHYQNDQEDATSLSGDEVVTLYLDQAGRLWVGTFNDGLNRFDPETQSFVRYQNDPVNPDSLSNDSILSIYQDSLGTLWVGTGGGGLNRFDARTERFVHYLESDGLPSNVIFSILEDDKGYLWLGTNNGLARFDAFTETFRNYTASDGLQGNEFNRNAAAVDGEGRLYFGGVNGLTTFDPDTIADSAFIPPVVLISITQDGNPLPVSLPEQGLPQVTIHWPRNNLEFEFAALSYAQPERNQYAYLLEGFDPGWNLIGNQRNGRYTNLPGDTFTLHLRGSNQDGVWNETGLSLTVHVVPPFWQTWWFQLSAGVGVLGLAATAYWLRLNTIRSYNRQLEQQVRDRTREIERLFEKTKELAVVEERNRLARELHDSAKQKAFAALAQLGTASGVLAGNPGAARNHLDEAENLVYEVIEELTFLIQEMYPLALKEKGLTTSLREYVFEWENRTDIQADVRAEGDARLPFEIEQALYRVIQESLSNVARHSRATHVEVVVSYLEQEVRASITDNGCGFELDGRHAGMGLRSIRERIETLEGSVSIQSNLDCGTRVSVSVPLKPGTESTQGESHA